MASPRDPFFCWLTGHNPIINLPWQPPSQSTPLLFHRRCIVAHSFSSSNSLKMFLIHEPSVPHFTCNLWVSIKNVRVHLQSSCRTMATLGAGLSALSPPVAKHQFPLAAYQEYPTSHTGWAFKVDKGYLYFYICVKIFMNYYNTII